MAEIEGIMAQIEGDEPDSRADPSESDALILTTEEDATCGWALLGMKRVGISDRCPMAC